MRNTLFFILVCTLLSGCEHTINHWREGDESIASGTDYPIKVTPSVSAVSLHLGEHQGLTQQGLESLNSLLIHQGRLDQQIITVQPYTAKGRTFAVKLQTTLRNVGAKQVIIAAQPYRAKTGAWDLRVQSQALVVSVPDCRIHDADIWTTKPYEAVGPLGCANRANIALMVADPADMLRARTLDSGDGAAAAAAVKRYQEDDLKELSDIDFNEDN